MDKLVEISLKISSNRVFVKEEYITNPSPSPYNSQALSQATEKHKVLQFG